MHLIICLSLSPCFGWTITTTPTGKQLIGVVACRHKLKAQTFNSQSLP